MEMNKALRMAAVWAGLFAGAMLAGSAYGGPGHDHDHGEARVAGPHGGRLLTQVEPHLEFLVDSNRHVVLTALDDAGGVIALSGQTASLTGGDRNAPFRMQFAPRGDQTLVSDIPLPEGTYFPVILRVSTKGEEQAKSIRFNLDLNACSACSYAEYACICAH